MHCACGETTRQDLETHFVECGTCGLLSWADGPAPEVDGEMLLCPLCGERVRSWQTARGELLFHRCEGCAAVVAGGT